MFDLIIRGGEVVTPEGVVTCDVAVAGETIAALAAPGTLAAESAKRVIDATRHIVMPGGIDPHVHHASCVDQARRHAARHGRTGAGRARGAVRRHDDAHRLCLLARRRHGAAGRRSARQGLRRKKPVRLGLSHHAAFRAAARILRAARGGDPGRLSDAEDIHHQHPAVADRPHDRLRRHLGGVPGAGEGGRARRHPCGRQRHRHAHVCEAHPRKPGELRAISPRSTISSRRT